jgi:uncharacterized protein
MVRLGGGSDNFIDRTGRRGLGGRRGGGNMLGCLLPLVASRFGLGGVVVLLVGYFILTSVGGGVGILPGGPSPAPQQGSPGQSTLSEEERQLLSGVLASTEEVWSELFRQQGETYRPAEMVAYTDYDHSGCGAAQAAMGPFYCPTDQRIYIDPVFFEELSRRF